MSEAEKSGQREHRTRGGIWAGLAGAALLAALVAGGAILGAKDVYGASPGRHAGFGGERSHAWMLEGALRWAGADAGQRDAVRAIARDAHAELEPLREAHRERLHAMAEALLAEAVDREALERLRQEELALAERASQRLLRAVADAAEQLTPEQRKELLEMSRFAH